MQTDLTKQIKQLFLKELKMELKNKYALWSLVLLLVVSVFIIYTIQKEASNKVWHSLFYVVLIFGVVQNIGRSFLMENKGSLLYYKFLVDSRAIIVSKIAYQFLVNAFFLVVLAVLMSFWLPQSIPHFWQYLVTALLFTLCNSAVFTFNSALALGAKNSGLVAMILSLPLLIPSLLVSLKSASKAISPLDNLNYIQDWGVLLLLLVMQLVLSVVLFKYVWEE
ncbi:heme exporter protein CcmB [Bacteroidia bacterium]|jgi:heme exporter protein B|nr:heme exporter protein CcmB [Bacteroidia bacterium]